MVRWLRFQTSRHLRCVFHGLRAPSVLGGHLPHPGVQERGPCPGPGLQRGPPRGDAVSLRPATPRLWRFRPWPHAECRFHRDRRRLGPEKNSVWHVSAADSQVGKTFLKMFISANVHSQIRSIFAGARSTCSRAGGPVSQPGGPVSQPGARVTAGGRGLGRLLHSLPGRTVEASWDGRLVPTPPPMRSAHERPLRLCPGPLPPQALRWQRGHRGGSSSASCRERSWPGSGPGHSAGPRTPRGPGRRGAGRPGRGFTSGHTGDRAGPRRLLQKTAGVTKSTRRGRAGATSLGNGPNVRAVTCAGASLTRRKAHRSPRGERASAGRLPCSWELCGRAADTAAQRTGGKRGPVLLTPPPPPAPLHVRPRVPAGDP